MARTHMTNIQFLAWNASVLNDDQYVCLLFASLFRYQSNVSSSPLLCLLFASFMSALGLFCVSSSLRSSGMDDDEDV